MPKAIKYCIHVVAQGFLQVRIFTAVKFHTYSIINIPQVSMGISDACTYMHLTDSSWYPHLSLFFNPPEIDLVEKTNWPLQNQKRGIWTGHFQACKIQKPNPTFAGAWRTGRFYKIQFMDIHLLYVLLLLLLWSWYWSWYLLFPTARPVGFQSLGLGLKGRDLQPSKSGMEPWNPGTLKP